MVRSLVLNVDSDSKTRNAVTSTLFLEGVDVREVSTASECLEWVEESDPDLIVISPEPEGMGGADLCWQLGKVSSATRVLRVSSSFPDDLIRSITDCGADAYVPEALRTAILAGTVRSLLSNREEARNRDRAKRGLEEAQEELHVFLSRITHNLSEPVRAVTTFIELIREGGSDRLSAAETRYMEHVLGTLDGARDLLRYLMAYAQISRDSDSSHRNIELSGVVLAAQTQLREEMDKAGAKVRAEGLPVVYGNPARLQQLMACLLSNALKYRNPETRPAIEIEASLDAGQRWRISVTDNGIGIAQQYHETIFAPFQRLHGREVPGAGMGLTLCRKIVESHGGSVWIESALGRGAAFLFTLPPART